MRREQQGTISCEVPQLFDLWKGFRDKNLGRPRFLSLNPFHKSKSCGTSQLMVPCCSLLIIVSFCSRYRLLGVINSLARFSFERELCNGIGEIRWMFLIFSFVFVIAIFKIENCGERGGLCPTVGHDGLLTPLLITTSRWSRIDQRSRMLCVMPCVCTGPWSWSYRSRKVYILFFFLILGFIISNHQSTLGKRGD